MKDSKKVSILRVAAPVAALAFVVVVLAILTLNTPASQTVIERELADVNVANELFSDRSAAAGAYTTSTNQQEESRNSEISESDLAPSPSPAEVQSVNADLRDAMVNIFCVSGSRNPLGSVSGSGVVVSESGAVLTNAHVAQRFLLQDYPANASVECIVRNGSPAAPAYRAELVYISPEWIFENKDTLAAPIAVGTGEDDFAILQLTGTISGAELPDELPFVPVTDFEVEGDELVVAAGYPAVGSSSTIRTGLDLISAFVPIQNRFTFERDTVDLISLGGIQIAEQGVSGGGVMNLEGELIGLLVTSSLAEDIDDRDVRAITVGHIARSFAKQHQEDFTTYLQSDLNTAREQFMRDVAPVLTVALLDGLGAF